MGSSGLRPLLTCVARAGCRFDDVRTFGAFVLLNATAALEGCSFSGQGPLTLSAAAVGVDVASGMFAPMVRVQNCTFSDNAVDVHVELPGMLYTDTPLTVLTVTLLSNVEAIQPLADAPAGEFPTMASPAFVALREVRPGRPAAAPTAPLSLLCACVASVLATFSAAHLMQPLQLKHCDAGQHLTVSPCKAI